MSIVFDLSTLQRKYLKKNCPSSRAKAVVKLATEWKV